MREEQDAGSSSEEGSEQEPPTSGGISPRKGMSIFWHWVTSAVKSGLLGLLLVTWVLSHLDTEALIGRLKEIPGVLYLLFLHPVGYARPLGRVLSPGHPCPLPCTREEIIRSSLVY